VALNFTFQSFQQTLYFDPSFGVLLDGNVGANGDGGGSNTNIYIGVFVSVGGVAILAILALTVGLVVGYFTMKQRAQRRANTMERMTNAMTEEEDPDVPN